MSRQELNIMIGMNKNNLKMRKEYYLAERNAVRKTELLKSIIKTNREINRLNEIKNNVA